MATVESILGELKRKASPSTRATYIRHGMPPERVIGVKVADMKTVARPHKGQQKLALDLHKTRIVEAMYLAAMLADGSQMSKQQLQSWVKDAEGVAMVGQSSVPSVVVESPHARELALEWIDSKKEHVAASGWCTYAGILATSRDEDLDLAEIKSLLARVAKEIHQAPNQVRYTMNNFVISVGTYVKSLLVAAKATAKRIGAVSVDMGDTACKVPLATTYIEKVESMGRVGKKRKTMRC